MPGWQQGLVTSLMLLPDPQLSGALLLEADIPYNGRIKKRKAHQERKISGSGLLALAAAWHQPWVAGSTCRYLKQLGGSSWRSPSSAPRLQKPPLPAPTLPMSYLQALPAIITSAPSQGSRYPHASCELNPHMKEQQPGTAVHPLGASLKVYTTCRAAVRGVGRAKLILEVRSLKAAAFQPEDKFRLHGRAEFLEQMLRRLGMTQLSQLEMDPNTGLVYNSLIQSSPESGVGQMLKLLHSPASSDPDFGLNPSESNLWPRM